MTTAAPAKPKAASANAATAKLRDVMSELKSELVEREVECDLLIRSLVARTHLLLIGPPGTAKSLLTRLFMSHMDDALLYELLFAKDTVSDQVLGPPSLPALKKEEYKRVTKGKLPEANVAFLDEVFKANSTVLNALLTLINERLFHNDGSTMDCSQLASVVGGSNEMPGPERDDLSAFRDRFAATKLVQHVRTNDGLASVLEGQIKRNRGETIAASHTLMTWAEIESVQKSALDVDVPANVIKNLTDLHRRAESENLKVSARRLGEGVKMMQAAAALSDRTALSTEDIKVFEHVLWTDPEDHKTAYELTLEYAGQVAKKASKLRGEFEEQQRTLNEVQKEMPTDGSQPEAELFGRIGSTSRKLKTLEERIKTAISDAQEEGHESGELDQLSANVTAAQASVKNLLGIGS